MPRENGISEPKFLGGLLMKIAYTCLFELLTLRYGRWRLEISKADVTGNVRSLLAKYHLLFACCRSVRVVGNADGVPRRRKRTNTYHMLLGFRN